MWNPIKIILTNFKSFEYQEYAFKKGAFLIVGENKTDDSQKSNGSGKSSLREGLCYNLDLPVYVDRVVDLIRTGTKECKVYSSFFNAETNERLEITRSTPIKGSSVLTILVNDEDQKDKFSTVPEGNKLIIEILDISKEDLQNHYIISKEKYTSFFSTSDSKVKELIGRFSNFNIVSGVEDVVSKDVEKLNSKLVVLQSDYDRLLGKQETINELIVKEQNVDIELQRQGFIQSFKEAIEQHKNKKTEQKELIAIKEKSIKFEEAKVKIRKESIAPLDEQLKELDKISYQAKIAEDNEKFKELSKRSDVLSDKVKIVEEELKEFNKLKNTTETVLGGAIECPKCSYEFILDEDVSLEEAKEMLPQIEEEIQSLESDIEIKEKDISTIKIDIGKVNDRLANYQKIINANSAKKFNINSEKNKINANIQIIEANIIKMEGDIFKYKAEIINCDNLTNQAVEGIEELKTKEIETKEKEYKEDLVVIKEQLKVKEKEVQGIKDQVFDTEQWIHRFKKFRSHLANESLEVIGGYANMYLEKMRTNLNIQLEGYKELKNGDIREKITPIVLRNGDKEGSGSFKRYSGGERGKIDFSLSVLALQDLINNNCGKGGLNLLFVDEITESIDSLGLESLVESLSELDRYIYVVSHVSHEKTYDKILKIEKINGISKII